MKSKHVFWLIIAIFALIAFVNCVRPRSPKEKQIPETDTIEQVVAPTVQEVLQWRENMRLDKYVDSVFLVMPEQVLTQILVTKGTDLSNHEIVSIYISNKDFYDKLIKRSMDIQKNIYQIVCQGPHYHKLIVTQFMPQYIRKLVLKHEDESLEQYETRVNQELEKLENYSEDEAHTHLFATDSQYLATIMFCKKDDSIKKKIGF